MADWDSYRKWWMAWAAFLTQRIKWEIESKIIPSANNKSDHIVFSKNNLLGPTNVVNS